MAKIENPLGLVTVKGLDETAILIRRELMTLPLTYTGEEFARMGVDMIPGIQYIMRQYSYKRYGGLMRPYYPGLEVDTKAVGKMEQNDLEVYLQAGIHEENIQHYRENIVGGMSLLGTNKTYKNPAERWVLYSVMKTWSEDLLDAFFFARRNPVGKSKFDIFDGIYTQIVSAKNDGRISTAWKNLVPTGALQSTGDDDASVFYKIESFLRGVHPVLVRGGAILNITSETDSFLQSAIANKFKNHVPPDKYGTYAMPGFPNIRIYPNMSMGSGDLMILSKGRIMQLGYDSFSDDEYIHARNIHNDINIVTYNIQARYGAGIRSFDPKVFCINDGTLTSEMWSGDIPSGKQKFTVTGSAVSNGTVAVTPAQDEYDYDTTVTFTATPQATYVFDKWSNGITTNPLALKISGNTNLVATFKPQP